MGFDSLGKITQTNTLNFTILYVNPNEQSEDFNLR